MDDLSGIKIQDPLLRRLLEETMDLLTGRAGRDLCAESFRLISKFKHSVGHMQVVQVGHYR